MLKRVRIRGYKTLRDVEVKLEPLSMLVGPNAAGKSNFLDALQLLSKFAGTRTLKEAFGPPYRGKPLESFSFDSRGIRGLLDQESVRFSIEADFEITAAIAARVEKRIRDMRDGTGDTKVTSPRSQVSEKYLRYRIRERFAYSACSR